MSAVDSTTSEGAAPHLFLTPQEVTEILNVDIEALRTLRDQDAGPNYYVIGATIRYRQPDVDEWQERRARSSGGGQG